MTEEHKDEKAPAEAQDGAAEERDRSPEGADGTEGGAETLEEALQKLKAERDELHQRLLRVAADFDNFRKRTRKELEEAERRGREAVLREVLPVIDNLERAVQSAAGAQSVEAVAKGVQMVLRLFEEAASRLGLQKVASVGERFDPNVHDAVQQHETEEHPPGTVVGELQPGYKLGERLLRAAMVVVARPPSGGGSDDGEAAQQPSEGAEADGGEQQAADGTEEAAEGGTERAGE